MGHRFRDRIERFDRRVVDRAHAIYRNRRVHGCGVQCTRSLAAMGALRSASMHPTRSHRSLADFPTGPAALFHASIQRTLHHFPLPRAGAHLLRCHAKAFFRKRFGESHDNLRSVVDVRDLHGRSNLGFKQPHVRLVLAIPVRLRDIQQPKSGNQPQSRNVGNAMCPSKTCLIKSTNIFSLSLESVGLDSRPVFLPNISDSREGDLPLHRPGCKPKPIHRT